MKCEQCKGFKFFWGSEIKGYKGDPSDRLPCLRCCSVSIFKRAVLAYWGYTNKAWMVLR